MLLYNPIGLSTTVLLFSSSSSVSRFCMAQSINLLFNSPHDAKLVTQVNRINIPPRKIKNNALKITPFHFYKIKSLDSLVPT